MTTEVALSQSLRTNLLSLQNTSDLIDDVTKKLATGRKVNEALDDPLNFFTAQSLTDRATDLSRLLDAIGQSISAIEQSLNGLSAIQKLVDQAEAIVNEARDALNDGEREARLEGAADLSSIDALTDLSGVDCGDFITISVTDPETGNSLVSLQDTEGNTTSGSIFISQGQTVESFIATINALRDESGDEVIEAGLDEDGELYIRSLNGGNLRVEFGDNEGLYSGEQSLAENLGFTNVEDLNEFDTDGTERVAITASAGSSIETVAFLDSNNEPFARSTLLTDLTDEDGNPLIQGGTGDSISISVNGQNLTTVVPDIEGATLQDFIDNINTDTTLTEFISASYDESTGQLSITADSAEVQSIQFGVSDDAVNSLGTVASLDLGIGALDDITPNAGSTTSESISFSSAADELQDLEDDYNSILEQIDQLVDDSNYRGTNLLNGDELLTVFNENRTSTLTTVGQILTSSGLGLSEADFGRSITVEQAATDVRTAKETLRSFGSTITNDLAVIQARESFTDKTINTLELGSDKLTLADENEEGVKLLALQTRSQLALQSLSLAAQGQAGVLQLF